MLTADTWSRSWRRPHSRFHDDRPYNPAMTLPSELQAAVDALLSQPGTTEPVLRRRLLERTRANGGPVPDILRDFVDKIAGRPWDINDEDFARLRTAGFSEDQLYELTLACALGAGLRRFDAGLRALEEAG